MDAKSAAARPALLAEYLSEQELAAELRKNPRTLQRWRKLRIGPPYTMNGETPIYHRQGALNWLQAGGTTGVAKARRANRPVAPQRPKIAGGKRVRQRGQPRQSQQAEAT